MSAACIPASRSFRLCNNAQRQVSGAGWTLASSNVVLRLWAPCCFTAESARKSPERLGNRSPRFCPQGVYPCTGNDQWCAISIQNDDQWRALLQLMGNPGWGTDSRFATATERFRFHDEIDNHIRKWTQTQAATDLESRLKQVGIPAERMRRIQDVMDSDDRSRSLSQHAGAQAWIDVHDLAAVFLLIRTVAHSQLGAESRRTHSSSFERMARSCG